MFSAGSELKCTRIIHVLHVLLFGLMLNSVSTGWSQLIISKTVTVDQNIPDRGQIVSSLTWSDHSGLATITDVNVGLSLSSASGSTMRLGQMYATVTFGTASESERVAVLLNREGVSSSSAFGSSLSSLNVVLDDSAPTNIYNLTTSTGTYQADGRIGVNPYGTRVAYSANQITAGLSALNGDWLSSSIWSLLVADTQAGNAAKLNSWSLRVEGLAPSSGTFEVGNNATVSGSGVVNSTLSTGSVGSVTLVVADGQMLSLNGGLTGVGNLQTSGGGTTVLSGNSSGFSGTVNVAGTGTAVIASTTALGAGSLVQSSGSSTVKFSEAGTWNNAMSVYNVAFTANGTVLAGRTTVNHSTFDVGNGNTDTLSGKITGSGGVKKTGLGTLLLAGSESNDFQGDSAVYAGMLKLQKPNALAISGSTIALHGGTLLLAAANQIGDATAVTLNGGLLNTGGNADRVGILKVTADSTIAGLVVSSGRGVATGSDFLFSGVDLTSYSTSSGSILTLAGVGYGQSVNFASSNYTGWTGYSGDRLNSFADKIQFGSTGMKAQLSFEGGTGFTYVTAIPEPNVYVGMAMLLVLVGVAETRRRKSAGKQ